FRLVERGQVIQTEPEKTFGVDRDVVERPIVFPSRFSEDEGIESHLIRNWSVTFAHVFGLTPFRDHFHTAIPQLLAPFDDVVWVWSVFAVPALTRGLLAL